MDVAHALGLRAEYSDWLASLEALSGDVEIPNGREAAELLGQIGVDEIDVEAVLEARAELTGNRQMLWLVERAALGVRQRVGDIHALVRMPALPGELGSLARCFWVFVYLATIRDIQAWHQRQEISDEISWDTLRDLGRHMRLYRGRNGVTGLDTQWWIALHFQGSLYALGRLQFQMYRLKTGPAGPLFWYEDSSEPGFRYGDPSLGLHIPASGPLSTDACDDSLARARPFFQRHFPEHADAVLTCTSWLLDEQLADYLPPDSNIMQFQRRFEFVPGAMDADSSTFQFVFNRPLDTINELTPQTTLERAIVQHLKNGKHWRLRTGWLKLP